MDTTQIQKKAIKQKNRARDESISRGRSIERAIKRSMRRKLGVKRGDFKIKPTDEMVQTLCGDGLLEAMGSSHRGHITIEIPIEKGTIRLYATWYWDLGRPTDVRFQVAGSRNGRWYDDNRRIQNASELLDAIAAGLGVREVERTS